MDHDFLDGIDEHFERLMKSHGNGNRNGGSRDRTLSEIMNGLEELSKPQKQEVLEFIRSLTEKSDQS